MLLAAAEGTQILPGDSFAQQGTDGKGGNTDGNLYDQRQAIDRQQLAEGKYDDAHCGSCQAGTDDPAHPVDANPCVFQNEIQIGQHGNGVADQGSNRRTEDIDPFHTDKHIVQHDFARHTGNQRIHGNALLAKSLQDAAGSLHHREQDNRKAGQAQ